MKRIVFSGLIAAASLFAGANFAQDNALRIENAMLEVRFDSAAGTFSLLAKPSQRVFLRDGQFREKGGEGRITAITDTTFGAGQAIEMLFPNLPFALFRSSLTNVTRDASVTRQDRPFTTDIDLGLPAAQLKTLGTGGLLAPEKNPGSYVWLAVSDPTSRRGVVRDWLTHERGSGVVLSRVEGEQVRLEPQIDYGRLRLEPDHGEDLETFAVGFFDASAAGGRGQPRALAIADEPGGALGIEARAFDLSRRLISSPR